MLKRKKEEQPFKVTGEQSTFPFSIPFQQIIEQRSWFKGRNFKELLEKIKYWEWKEDYPHVNHHIGLSVASAFYGQHLKTPAEIYGHAQHLMRDKNIPNITDNSGFTELFQATSGLTEAEALETEKIVAKRLIERSAAQLNKKPSDIDLFIVATSVPSHQNLEDILARSAGIRRNAAKFLYVRACDSSGSALYDVVSGKFDDSLKKRLRSNKPATITIFGFEDANRLSNNGGDPFSAQLFSTAASAMTFAYHPQSENTTFKLIVGEHSSVPDGAEALKVKKTYKNWPKKPNTFFTEYLQEPPNGEVILMDPKLTPVVFKKHGLRAVENVLQKYMQKRGRSDSSLPRSVKKVIMHHPSATIFNHVIAGLTGNKGKARSKESGLGFDPKQFEWVINEGNAPSAIMPIAFGRQMNTLTPNDTIMVLTYGAGGSFTCGFYKLGRGFK